MVHILSKKWKQSLETDPREVRHQETWTQSANKLIISNQHQKC